MIKGILILSNGDIFEGEFKDGIEKGHRIYKFHNGDIFEGEYKDGK